MANRSGRLMLAALLGLALATAARAAPAGDTPADAKHPDPVVRAQFSTAVRDHEPVDRILTLPNTTDHVYYFTEIQGMEGKTIIHRWEYRGQVMAEVKFQIGGPRWRIYSEKTLNPDWVGQWTVVVTDGSGWPLHADVFDYVAAPRAPPTGKTDGNAPAAPPHPPSAGDTTSD